MDYSSTATTSQVPQATVIVSNDAMPGGPISAHLMGKFCEHLGTNIYHGMDAQLMDNPTFAQWLFRRGESLIDGGEPGEHNPDRIMELIRETHSQDTDVELLIESYRDALAYPWRRLGSSQEVVASADTGPYGGRAQRVETGVLLHGSHAVGIYQPVWLPLHRVRTFMGRIVIRSPSASSFRVELAERPGAPALSSQEISLSPTWSTSSLELNVPERCSEEQQYIVRIVVPEDTNLVIGRLLLYPCDHRNYADPDIIRLLKRAHLPLLRWPGGNFVSGYHWKDAIGPVDERITTPNPAWGGVEYNLFGTDEFIAFCREVSCEPMICINAGNGTPREAAEWVEYCNGAADTAMGALRAQNGHPEPYNVMLWEIGNELWGRWQINWTTPRGNADRYSQFAKAMLQADGDIELIATGAQCIQDSPWTQSLLRETKPIPTTVTDHILSIAEVNENDDPEDIYHAYCAHSLFAGNQYRWLRTQMIAAGIESPGIAITEMQIFAQFNPAGGEPEGNRTGLTPENLVGPDTLAEAIHFAGFLCESTRQEGFVRLITHSATVNHGGGLRKTGERVWANPIHYCHQMCSRFIDAIPLSLSIESACYSTKRAYGFIPALLDVPIIDGIAANHPDGHLLLLLLSRGIDPLPVSIMLEDTCLAGLADSEVQLTMLTGSAPWDRNTENDPYRIVPMTETTQLKDNRLQLVMPGSSIVTIAIPASHASHHAHRHDHFDQDSSIR